MKQQARILIADDEQATCRYIDRNLKMEPSIDAVVDFAHDREEAIGLLDTQPPYDLLLIDLWMPDALGVLDKDAGLKILKHCKKLRTTTQAIVITANSSSETALEASGLGIYEYISKPIDYTRLTEIIKAALSQHERLVLYPDESPFETERSETEDYRIIGKSDVMIDVMKKVGRVASSSSDVLIYGESGTGKELVARAIHKLSHRKGPFVVVNCSAIPSELIEAELFGIGKRVATSVDQRAGKFQEARGGTILLDEIGELSLEMQPKLLRVLDYKEIQGVGLHVQRIDVRIIAATNRDLRAAVEAGKFRNDLYYRLKPMIPLPLLWTRQEDIPLLAEHFLHKHARTPEQKRIRGFDNDVLATLQRYHWPGNVRELEKVVEYAVLTCKNSLITLNDLPPEVFDEAASPNPPIASNNPLEAQLRSLLHVQTLKEASQGFEKIFLAQKLEQNNWNIQKTAKQVGMRRQSLHRKLNQLELQRDTHRVNSE